jgi:A/G-specific adenine glycosylase
VVSNGTHYLLRRVAPGQLMQGLYEFPYLELSEPCHSPDEILLWLREEMGIDAQQVQSLPLVRHSFTRYRASLYPYHIRCRQRVTPADYTWYPASILQTGAFPSGHRSIVQHLLSHLNDKNIF